MPSLNKTPDLGLNQWQGNEYPKREDFASDNEKIDSAIGDMTIDDSLVPTGNTGLSIKILLSWLGNMVKAITGKSSWRIIPDISLSAAKTHIDAVAPHGGHETPAGAQAKVDTHAGVNASTATKGHIQLATNAEVTAGIDSSKAVTPAGAKVELDKKLALALFTAANDFIIGAGAGSAVKKSLAEIKTLLSIDAATETKAGIVEMATIAEATAGTDTTRAITAAGLKAALDALVAAAPGALDTLNELAAALGDDPNFATTMTNALAGKIDKSLATAANDFLVATAAGTWGKKTLAEVRTLLSCLLTTGGTMAGTLNMSDQKLTRARLEDYAESVGITPATTGTCTFDITTGNVFAVTPTGAITIGLTNAPANGIGGSVTIWITNGATVYAKTFGAGVKWPGDEIPDMSEPNKTYGVVLTSLNGGTAYRAACIGPFSA